MDIKTNLNRSKLLACFAFASTFAGCPPNDGPIEIKGGSWTISGKTYLAGSTEPLSGVVVECAGLSSTSGADGYYEIRAVPQGAQTLTAEKVGTQSYSQSIEVSSDVTYYVYLSLMSASLSGFVTNAVDGPIQGARVTIRGLLDITDVSGRYEFSNVPRGIDTLEVSHPHYREFKTSLALDSSGRRFDVILRRDLVLEGSLTMTRYVDALRPNQPYLLGPPGRVYLMANSYDSLGQYARDVRRYIYINFYLPPLLADPLFLLVEASLQLCTDDAYPSFGLQTYAVMSTWGGDITFNNQPAVGSLLYSDSTSESPAGRYWAVVRTEGLARLLTEYRANGIVYGIVIKGGGVGPIGFYSIIADMNKPKLTFKVQY